MRRTRILAAAAMTAGVLMTTLTGAANADVPDPAPARTFVVRCDGGSVSVTVQKISEDELKKSGARREFKELRLKEFKGVQVKPDAPDAGDAAPQPPDPVGSGGERGFSLRRDPGELGAQPPAAPDGAPGAIIAERFSAVSPDEAPPGPEVTKVPDLPEITDAPDSSEVTEAPASPASPEITEAPGFPEKRDRGLPGDDPVVIEPVGPDANDASSPVEGISIRCVRRH